jgi:hypothetical protein
MAIFGAIIINLLQRGIDGAVWMLACLVMREHKLNARMILPMASVDSDGEESISQGIARDETPHIHEKLQPTKDATIGPADVLCGRGKTSFNHGEFASPVHCARLSLDVLLRTVTDPCMLVLYSVGNKRFREAVAEALPSYMKADNRYDKSLVVHAIVNNIRLSGGRFLKHNSTTGAWCELNDQQAKEKVGHAVRDAVTAYESRKSRKRHRAKEEFKSDKQVLPTASLHEAFASLSTSFHRQTHGPNPASEPRVYSSTSAANLATSDIPNPSLPSTYQESIALPPTVLALHDSTAAALHDDSTTVVRPDSSISQPLLHLGNSQPQHEHNHDDHHHSTSHDPHDQFLAAIDSVLGPLPPDASDPMHRLLHDQRQQRHNGHGNDGPGSGGSVH